MELQSYATLEDLALYLNLTEEELSQQFPNAQRILNQITIQLKNWIFPNSPKGHEECLREASLHQWDYMQSEAYQMAVMPRGISGFKVMDWSVTGVGNSKYGAAYDCMSPFVRDLLMNCGLLCRATCCGRAPC